MSEQGPSIRVVGRRPGLAGMAIACLLLISTAGCSERAKTVGQIRAAFDKGDYDETLLLCQHALRRDIRDARVYYYYGFALLEKGRDYESFRRLEEAVEADSTMQREIAAELLKSGKKAAASGERRRAAERLKVASKLDPGVDLGRLIYLTADAYFQDREFADAARLYARAVKEWPDTAVAEASYYNLASSRIALSDSTAALKALEEMLEHFPKGPLAVEAKWKLVNLLYEHARAEFARGNYESVIEEIGSLLERTTNTSLVQRARFVLGEAYERLEDYRSAYDQYQAIIDEDQGASGRIVDRAREKINTFHDSGLL